MKDKEMDNDNTTDNMNEGNSLSDKLDERKEEWNEKIKTLNSLMKNLPSIDSLLNKIYAERQDAVDYYFILLKFLGHWAVIKNKKYAESYKQYKTNSQIRYTSDAMIKQQIDADLTGLNEKITYIDNQAKYMQETIKTIDAMIFGIKSKIDIHKLIENTKF